MRVENTGYRDCPVLPSGVVRASDQECREVEDLYLDQLEEIVRYSLPKGKSLAGFFAESIQGVGGSVQYPRGFLKRAFSRVRELGGVCISDEVQTGFGRTGDHFWGFQVWNLGPGISNSNSNWTVPRDTTWFLTLSPWLKVSVTDSLWRPWSQRQKLRPK